MSYGSETGFSAGGISCGIGGGGAAVGVTSVALLPSPPVGIGGGGAAVGVTGCGG